MGFLPSCPPTSVHATHTWALGTCSQIELVSVLQSLPIAGECLATPTISSSLRWWPEASDNISKLQVFLIPDLWGQSLLLSSSPSSFSQRPAFYVWSTRSWSSLPVHQENEAVTATPPQALLLLRKPTRGPWIPHLPTAPLRNGGQGLWLMPCLPCTFTNRLAEVQPFEF